MNKELTEEEIIKTRKLCFVNPVKACAIAQEIIDTCQLVSCSIYAELTGDSKRTVLYKAKKLTGVEIDGRKFISINQ